MRTTVLALIAIVSLPLVSEAQSTLSFPRVMRPADFSRTGFALVNPGSTNAAVTFNLYGSDGGAPLKTSTQIISAKGQIAKLASELFPGVQSAGWVQATSAAAGLQGFWFGGDFVTFADGAEAASSASELVLPLVTPQSEINIANTGAGDVTVLIDLLGQEGGDLAMPYPQHILAKGFFRGDVASLFMGVDDLTLPTHLRITCGCANPSPFAATLIARDFIARPSWAVMNAVPASTSTLTINFPHVVDGPQGSAIWKSVLGVTNLSARAPNDVTIAFMAANGTPGPSIQRTIPPNGSLRELVQNLFRFPPGYQDGWVRVSSTSGLPVTGFVAYAETNASGVAVVPPQQEAQTDLLFAHIADLRPWFTGIALLNTNTRAANVQVFALNSNGSLIGTAAFSLGAGAKTAKLLSELVPQTQTRATDGGFLFVRSDLPLFGIELFFSRSLQILSNVAAGKILPGINYVPPTR